MIGGGTGATVAPEILMDIVQAQTEIAQQNLDLGQVMTFVTGRVQKLTGAAGAIVELAEEDDMVYRAASGMAAGKLGLRLRRNNSLSGLCVAQRQVLRCDDSETDPRADRNACRRVGLRSMVVAPLSHRDTVVGVLKITAADAGHFSDTHVRILEMMSGLISAAMFHAAQVDTDDLYHKATHDGLTGLANRALFYDRLRQELALAQRQSSRLGLLSLDMDGLKPINDTFGHRAGDAAIHEMGRRIRGVSRRTDTVARLGGDEFAVIMVDIDDRDAAMRHVDRLSAAIGEPFAFEGRSLPLGASVGLVTCPEDGAELDVLMEKADQAMYAIKRTRATHRVSVAS